MASSISEAVRRRAVAAVVLVAVAFGGAPVARAQQPATASDATRAAARDQLVEGVNALKRGDYQAALARFGQAYALVPSPKIHYDFGLAYLGLGRQEEALAAFQRFLADAPDAPPDKREKATSFVAKLLAEVGETKGRGERDAPGTPAVAAVAAGRPDAPSSPVDAELAAFHPADANPPPAVDPDPLRARRITAVSLGAAGAGLLVAGLVFGVLAQRESDGLTHDSQIATVDHPTPFDTGKESRGVTYERLQIVGLVAGVVAVAAGAAVYATTRRRVTVEPIAGNAGAGANVRLTF